VFWLAALNPDEVKLLLLDGASIREPMGGPLVCRSALNCFAWPAPRFKFEVKLAKLASRSPETNLPPGPVPFPVPPFAPGSGPPTPPCGCKISPKKLAPTPMKQEKIVTKSYLE